ncbi:unnamed protein product [Blepharisma stoltei]|uniref:Peptidase M24 domain-containing protein n=1 Tax=Blepharisma stoltei TaxID=1481888 RepID=A0AAU9JG12_9CILI|nr:unnamed protein product [Blepharisma stoltei]
METEEQVAKGLTNPNVVSKYREAANIVNRALQALVPQCQAGADVSTLCSNGDQLIEQGLATVFTSAPIEKGIAVPTCISVNHICAHYSPLPEESYTLQPGDLIKIELGAHIDGYIANAATSLIVGASAEAPISGNKADVTLAAYNAIQAALRLIKPGSTNTEVTQVFNKIATDYGCNVLEGVLSHEIKQHVIDGNHVIIGKESFDQHVEEFQFGANEAYIIDIFLSTGEGKPKESEQRTTVFQRALDMTYNLKLKSSRNFLTEVNRRFPTLLFSLRSFADQRNARVGVSECLNHNMLYSFPVITEKPDDFVAQFKVTVLVLETGTIVITPLIFSPETCQSDKTVTDEAVKALLATPMATVAVAKPKKAKKNKKKKKAAAEGETKEETEETKAE